MIAITEEIDESTKRIFNISSTPIRRFAGILISWTVREVFSPSGIRSGKFSSFGPRFPQSSRI
jgi:hypothetical protein